jgi:2-dehydro-3-deoxygluconokinase
MNLDVVTFGEPLFMFYANETGELEDVSSWSRALAGAETNVATGFSRLGLNTGLVTKLGEDSFGRFITKAMEEENIDTTGVKTTDEQFTGMYLKGKVEVGDPGIEYFRKGSAASTMSIDDFDKDYFSQAKLLHMTSIFAALSENTREFSYHVAKEMKEMGKIISFDPNLRLNLWDRDLMIKTVNELAEYADIIMPGLGEGEILTGYDNSEDIAKFYLDKGVKLVVVTEADGAYYATPEETGFVKGYDVKAIDTVGAGDGFAVGVNSAYLEGLSVEEAILRGNAIGARQVTFAGDNDGLPTREELEEFMKNTKRKA